MIHLLLKCYIYICFIRYKYKYINIKKYINYNYNIHFITNHIKSKFNLNNNTNNTHMFCCEFHYHILSESLLTGLIKYDKEHFYKIYM